MRFKARTLACLTAAAAVNSAFATNGYFTHGIGPQSKAMAGTGVASPGFSGPAIVATNPALGAFLNEGLEVGLGAFSPRRSYRASASAAQGQGGAFTIGEGEVDSSRNLFAIPFVAQNWTLESGRRLTLMAYGRGGMNTTWDAGSASARFDPDGPGPAGVGTFPGPFGGGKAGVDLSQLFVTLNYAGRQSERFAWGVAPLFALQTFEATGLGAFAPYTGTFAASGGTVAPSGLTNNDHDFSYGFGFSAGAWWAVTDNLSAGLAYQSRMEMSEFDSYSDLFAQQGGFDIPSSIKAGLSYRANDRWRVNFDIEHTAYSEIDSVGNPMALILSCPTAGMGGASLESCLGGSNGAGFGWRDMTTYKVGAAWNVTDQLVWRFGYSVGEQPIRAPDALFNILAPGVMEQHFTTGFTARRGEREYSLAFMFAPKKTITGNNLFDPTQTLDLSMRQFELEFSMRF